ncbi:hypothetical protein GGR50DRAFT_90021 [Xylaria sp. CBS 124048]|nr:hypothetical protein GGR50DRAFT_90021 [Xylaria sp. CBS 124048]
MAIRTWSAIGCSAAGLTILAISTQLAPFHRYQARREEKASPTHLGSFPVSLILPSHHHSSQENYTVCIPASHLQKGVTDEEILARFTKGFLSGCAFTLERWLLSSFSYPILTDVQAIKKSLTPRSQSANSVLELGPLILDPSSISPTSTPSVSSLLFRNFVVLDSSSSLTAEQQDRLPGDYDRHVRPPHAFLELAWGGDGLGLVGSHRFEVCRGHCTPATATQEAEEFVKITLSTVSCVPRTGQAPRSSFLICFHVLYSKALFSDGIRGLSSVWLSV